MTPTGYLTYCAKEAIKRKTDWVYVVPSYSDTPGQGPTLSAALAAATGHPREAFFAFEPGVGDLLACQNVGILQVFYAMSKRDAEFAVKLKPKSLQKVREFVRAEYVPLWDTRPSPEPSREPHPTSLADFIDMNCLRLPGARRLLLRDFYSHFQGWLSAGQKAHWPKGRVQRELSERGFPIVAGTGNKRFVSGLSIMD